MTFLHCTQKAIFLSYNKPQQDFPSNNRFHDREEENISDSILGSSSKSISLVLSLALRTESTVAYHAWISFTSRLPLICFLLIIIRVFLGNGRSELHCEKEKSKPWKGDGENREPSVTSLHGFKWRKREEKEKENEKKSGKRARTRRNPLVNQWRHGWTNRNASTPKSQDISNPPPDHIHSNISECLIFLHGLQNASAKNISLTWFSG